MSKGGMGCLSIFIIAFIIGIIINIVKFIFHHISDIFLFISLMSLLFVILGFIFPAKLAFWSKKKSRLAGGLGYLAIAFIFFILFGITAPSADTPKTYSDTQTASSNVKKDNEKTSNGDKQTAANKDVQSEDSKTDDKNDKTTAKTVVSTSSKSKKSKYVPVTLTETVDGDTIKVRYKGKEETVRYLLVDTPESKKTGTCVQPYAKSAYTKNKQLVNSGKLSLEFESSAKRDKYGRLLAYVYVDGKSVQESLLKGGYARVAYIYDPPYKHLSQYQKDENIAKNKDLNIWSKSRFVTDRGFIGCASSSTKKSTSNVKKSYNSNSTGSNSSSSSASTNSSTTSSSGAEYFANCTELRTKYPNGVPASHPAYQAKMDRDKDNFACER
ncbi:thermonuclease family protein [uncultured Rummeliibacillus sp.]|uniref:thermonuclease family protein n=1 Tax=uncultured Rummeliibacillus sp. TaxID=762292 RepID=UPI00262DC91A|nr:thermonuclease family protein [uncultured Rummeliibacillus sp.]